MHIDRLLEGPVLPSLESGVWVLAQYRVLTPPPPTHLLLHLPQRVRGVAVSVELHHILLKAVK